MTGNLTVKVLEEGGESWTGVQEESPGGNVGWGREEGGKGCRQQLEGEGPGEKTEMLRWYI